MKFARFPSLELSWLPISERKGLPTPAILFHHDPQCSGCYLARGEPWDQLEHCGERDVLMISTAHGARPSTIAHEFRHMQQRYVTALPRIGFSPALDFGDTLEAWERAVKVFYRRPWELDALRFESRLAPDDTNEHAMRITVHARGWR